MQKVVGPNPISRSENPRICGGFLVVEPDHRLPPNIWFSIPALEVLDL
jgi:hypothetical protein